jgi:nitroimidazol reductase NimA-like FMN-containing flavoprotein (pyridoxamine 5'-phosphate oxidase superfamily)
VTAPLSPTPRTRLGRSPERGRPDRAELHAFLQNALVAHVGVVIDGHPVVLPTAYAIDLDGPDTGGTLYLHGSVAARWLQALSGSTICATITEIDGLVVGRSGFHHSMNYRSAVIVGTARVVADPDERARALDLIVDHAIPGRSGTLRPHTRKELAATLVVAMPLHEASLKMREGGSRDDAEDVEAGIWGGHIPLHRVADAPVPSEDAHGVTPVEVVRRARDLGAH